MNKKYKMGDFTIQPIAVEHNVENYAYIITHPQLGKMVYAVDCVCFPFKINEVDYWVVEANHDEMLMIDNMCAGHLSRSHNENHLSIDQTIEILKVNKAENSRVIVLAHLSDDNSNASDFQRRVSESMMHDSVYIADEGLKIEL